MYRLMCQSLEEAKSRLQNEPVLIVIDNVEALPSDERVTLLSEIHQLLRDGPSRAIIASRFDLIAPYTYKTAFPGLTLQATIMLLREEAALRLPKSFELANASTDQLRKIWKMSRGMPLALHLVIGQSEHYELSRIIAALEEARAQAPVEAFYTFLFKQAWQEIGRAARGLLVYLGVATLAPQTSQKLMGVILSEGLTLDETTLAGALAELLRWYLVERLDLGQSGRVVAYELHPLTRFFVSNPEIRAKWEPEFDEASFHDEAFRKHQEILENGAAKGGTPETSQGTLLESIPDFIFQMRHFITHDNPKRVIWYWQQISGYLWLQGRYGEHLDCERYAIAAAEQIEVDDPVEGKHLQALIAADLAFVYLDMGELDQAEGYVKRAEQLLRQIGGRIDLSRILRIRANIHFRQRDYTRTLQLCQEALQLVDQEASDLDQLQLEAAQNMNRRTATEASFYSLNKKEQLLSLKAPLYNLLGATYRKLQDHPSAVLALNQALSNANQLPEGAMIYYSLAPLLNLSKVYISSLQLKDAKQCLRQCMLWTSDCTRPDIRAGAILGIANYTALKGYLSYALHFAQEAAVLYEAIGKYNGQDKAFRFIQSLAGKSNQGTGESSKQPR
jgi:tetratricopeptide (TPR) repeat protein